MKSRQVAAMSVNQSHIQRWWSYVFAATTVVYLALVVVPTLRSDIAGLAPEAIMAGTFAVPFYPTPMPLPLFILGVLVVVAAWSSVPLAVGFVYELVRARESMPRRTLVKSLLVNVFCTAIVGATLPLAYAFLTWLVD